MIDPNHRYPICVTQPDLPPLEDFLPMLKKIWDSKVLTNGGPFQRELENALCEYLDVPYISLFTNGTIGLITALTALDITGDVITTPYSFVATAHALLWNNLNPIFVDVEPKTFNIDPTKIEEAITPQTTAILAVHCYGNPCDVDAIEGLANRYNLAVVYDAAHAFGVQCHCGSILNHGDFSVLSLHATKVFNTLEGGAVVCPTIEMKNRIDQLKNFGLDDSMYANEVGINGKMNEMQAAFGLLQLEHIDKWLARRRTIAERYRQGIAKIRGLTVVPNSGQTKENNSYFPVIVEDDYPLSRNGLCEKLETVGIFVRRYFYPLLTDFTPYMRLNGERQQSFPTAHSVAARILCLPIYPSMKNSEIEAILKALASNRTDA